MQIGGSSVGKRYEVDELTDTRSEVASGQLRDGTKRHRHAGLLLVALKSVHHVNSENNRMQIHRVKKKEEKGEGEGVFVLFVGKQKMQHSRNHHDVPVVVVRKIMNAV